MRERGIHCGWPRAEMIHRKEAQRHNREAHPQNNTIS